MKPSEELQKLVTKWRIAAYHNHPFAGAGIIACADELKSFIPAVEQLEQAEWKGRLEELELCADSPMPILEWYGRRKPFLLQKLGGAE